MAQDRDRTEDGGRRPEGISELIRGAISTGMKSVLVTEEGVRSLLGDLVPKVLGDLVPKEVSATVKAHIDGMKKELYSTLVSEFSQFLQKADLAGEMRKFFSGTKVTMQIELRFEEEGKKGGGKARG